MNDTTRRLPRSNAPQPDESLAGYLLNLAHRLDVAPHELVRRTGIKPTGRISLLDLNYATSVPDDVRERFAATTGLTETEVIDLTTERFGALLHMGRPGRDVARSGYGNQWLTPGRTRYCPDCVGGPDPNRASWRVHWLTAWNVACTRHQTLLLDTCPTCSTPVGEPGPKGFRSLIPQITLPGVHPASCRAWNGPKTVCGTRLDQATAPAAPPAVLDLQKRLDDALDDAPTTAHVLGTPISQAQWLRDLRLTQILLQVARDDTPFEDVPYGDKAAAFVRDRTPNVGRTGRGTRTATQAPDDTAAAAGLLLAADRLLRGHGQPEQLNRLARTADDLEPVMWASTRNHTVASDGLTETFNLHKRRLTQPARLRAYTRGHQFTYTANHVPPYLDADTFTRHFDDVRGPSNADTRSRYERPLRRYVPIALVMLITDLDATAAGNLLGYNKTATDAGTARASEAFRALGEPELLRRIALVATELDDNPRVNWQHRRAAFTTDWTIPDHHWQALQQAVPRKNTPWEQRRPAFNAWVWALVTSSDIKDAPMTRTTTNGRTNTGGVSGETYNLIRRCGPRLHHQVNLVAQRIAATIDENTPQLAR